MAEVMKMGTAKLVDDAIVANAEAKDKRTYMGASILGTECDRALWYKFKHPTTVDDARVLRIFELGHRIEDIIIADLRLAGITVFTHGEDGEQFGFTDGVIAGHCDGVLTGLPESTKPHLFEAKSANDKRFKEFVKKGCVGVSQEYLVQCQVYMLKFDLENCLFVVYNKNTSEYYFERIKLNKPMAEMFINRGKDIAEMEDEPKRKYGKSTFFKCRFCNYNERCWEDENETKVNVTKE